MKIYWSNPYLTSFKKFERRVIELSHIIKFDDNQMHTYSHEISDLIISIGTKVESVSKDFYETKIYPYLFDKNADEYSESYFSRGRVEEQKRMDWTMKKCLNSINELVNLSSKVVILNSAIFSFKEYSCVIRPFGFIENDKKIKGGLLSRNHIGYFKNESYAEIGWIEAYNSLKHDYVASVSIHGNLINLIFSLSSFYLLMIYYEFFDNLRSICRVQDLDNGWFDTLGSELFSVGIQNTIRDIFISKSGDSRGETTAAYNSSTLLIIQNKETYEKSNKLINEFREKNPNIKEIDIDIFTTNSLNKEDCKYILFDKIAELETKFGHSFLIILNEGKSRDKYRIHHGRNEMSKYDEKHQNKIIKFLDKVKEKDRVDLFINGNTRVTGELIVFDKETGRINVRTDTGILYKFSKFCITKARILND